VNAVEIEEAVSELVEQDFDPADFPFAFLEAYGNKESTLKMLRNGKRNASDVDGAVLQRNNIHILVCSEGEVANSLDSLRDSGTTSKAKAKFILATDGKEVQAEDMASGDTLACEYPDIPAHFLFFASLAGISFTKSIENPELDVRATGRLNRLYVELLRGNPEWASPERRHDMNHFMARIIFCFFAEDTDIFVGDDLFTSTIEQMSDSKSENTHEVIAELFRAMDTKVEDRKTAKFRPWANTFPYVNGGLFAGSCDAPKFSRIARTYLIHAGKLDWQKINPDIFGSMIQAVTDEEERGSLGMHYTSVENILKLLNPLFLDDLREKLHEAGDNDRKLLNLRKRIAKIRVFDPACGSGNFLVIAYKQMREIEFEINKRRDETHLKSEIPLTNFRGIELRDFPAEIARLALIIAEYQCDVVYRGQIDALAEFLPLNEMNWITQGNALRIDWLSVCPPTGTSVKYHGDELLSTPLDQAEIDFENEGGETYICGNPPYIGTKRQSVEQKEDMELVFEGRLNGWKSLDYVAGWFFKAAQYSLSTVCESALVSTNSICQGQQVPILWPFLNKIGVNIDFAHTSFQWSNLASHNAGVTVVIVGCSTDSSKKRRLYSEDKKLGFSVKEVSNINPYLVPGNDNVVEPQKTQISNLPEMYRGNSPTDGGHLILEHSELEALEGYTSVERFVKQFVGSYELIRGTNRFCLWIEDEDFEEASSIQPISNRIDGVRDFRLSSKKAATVKAADWPHRFDERKPLPDTSFLCVPVISSVNREYLPIDILPEGTVISNKVFGLPCDGIWPLAIIASKLNLAWVSTVCARMRTDYSYTNTLGWNTFPVPKLTVKNKADLTKSAEGILLAREAYFPANIADMYEVKDGVSKVPENLRRAHERNDEVLERIYIGRRFKNDTERLEKLFDLYTKMTAVRDSTKQVIKKV
jgi:MmeI, DNA-methyltransferase domain/MmeI, target recognition domain/MmeI, N-terminal domain/MmeI, helicase spacer domain/MmeI, C-terminal domain